MERRIVVGGSNVAFKEKSAGGDPTVSNLIALRRELKERGLDPIIIVDASQHHKADDPEQLIGLSDNKQVQQVTARVQADYGVLEIAEKNMHPFSRTTSSSRTSGASPGSTSGAFRSWSTRVECICMSRHPIRRSGSSSRTSRSGRTANGTKGPT